MVLLGENPFLRLAQQKPGIDPAIDPQQIYDQLRAGAAGSDNSPSAQSATNLLPSASLDTLTAKFDVTRIPQSRLRQMMRDPHVAFALFFIRAQLLRARWAIECSDPQVAAFVDSALREIYSSLVSQYMMKLVFGYQALIKRFQLFNPDWTYFDVNGNESPVWNEGNIQALIWKPFASVPPESADPNWTPQGEFAGIKYTPSRVVTQGGTATGTAADYDVLHSLWLTNEKESVNGSLWGYPRIGYAYRFWWTFWFNWGLVDRHFEKDADPPAIVYYPANKPALKDSSGNTISRRQMALNIGDRARSNSTIALPSDVVIDDAGAAKNMREWEITFAKGGENFDAFKDRFDQLGMLILRSCMVPEQAFEAKGGTAGYNSTGQLQDAFTASQIVLMQELDFDINRYVIPQLIAANFPDRPVKAKKVTKGFDTQDIDLAKAIIQSMANSNFESLNIDTDALIDSVGLPLLTPDKIKKQELDKQINRAQNTQIVAQKAPEMQPPKAGVAGVTKEGLYYQPRDVINLQSNELKAQEIFMQELVSVGALRDPLVMNDASRLRTVWQDSLTYDFAVASSLVQDFHGDIDLADSETYFERFFRRVSNRAQDSVAQTRRVLQTIMRRAGRTELDKANLADYSFDPLYSEKASKYLQDRADAMVDSITNTTRNQVKVYLSDLIKNGTPAEHMPQMLQQHFKMFSTWRADTIVRTEVRNAYNMATLLAAEDAGIKQVQAIDAQLGPDRSDPKCIERNGKVMTLSEAYEALNEEHPNGTLQFRILKKPVKVKRLPVPKGKAPVLASFQDTGDEITVTVSTQMSENDLNKYCLYVGDSLLTEDVPALVAA